MEKAQGQEPDWPLSEVSRKKGLTKNPPAKSDFCFNALYPVPKEILSKGFDKTGRRWCDNHWGTKWDAYDLKIVRGENEVTFLFTTAWEPPKSLLQKVAGDFPELSFALSYSEESGGRFLFCNGKFIGEEEEEGNEGGADDDDDDENWEETQTFYATHEEWVEGLKMG